MRKLYEKFIIFIGLVKKKKMYINLNMSKALHDSGLRYNL